MKLAIEIDFWFDGMDDCAIDEIEKSLDAVFESGAESTCTELTLLNIKKRKEV
ncbi:hypothetical protein [Virgibacillus sp. Bac332]|uniref:hypothetical protein n=1 Tax=Virgibacillus sp. Bac332 TaxID=2419842 RepID=UPI0013CEE546|nr:hypothetical protein [Virgibacillus sp. Bac332]